MEFRFDGLTGQKSSERPVFIIDNGVAGKISLSEAMQRSIQGASARVEVDLQGFMTTNIDTATQSHAEFRITTEKRIMHMTQSIPISQRQADSTGRYDLAFTFDVKSWLRLQNNSRHRTMSALTTNFLPVPPSLRHEIEVSNGHAPRAAARVTYRLAARLVRQGKTIHTIKQAIVLLFSTGPSPPICQADFQGEFKSQQSSVLKSFLKSVGKLSVELSEPQQLLIGEGKLSVIQVPIALRWYGGPLRIDADITWQIRFSTFVSLSERHSPPTLKEAMTASTALVRSSIEPRSLAVSWHNWRPGYADGLECEEKLKLSFPRSEVMTPSFWSPFLCRRYSIRICIKVTAPGTAKYEMEVPLQVGLEKSISAHDVAEVAFEELDGDELLPQYSR